MFGVVYLELILMIFIFSFLGVNRSFCDRFGVLCVGVMAFDGFELTGLLLTGLVILDFLSGSPFSGEVLFVVYLILGVPCPFVLAAPAIPFSYVSITLVVSVFAIF